MLYYLEVCPSFLFLLELYAGLSPINGDTPLSSSPQGPIFTGTSTLASAVKEVNCPHPDTSIDPFFVGSDPIADSDPISEAGSFDMDRLDLDLSLCELPLRSNPLAKTHCLPLH